MSIIETLNSLNTLTPDQIVAELVGPVIFDRKTFLPWEVPEEYQGRFVLIENYLGPGSVWWHGPGQGQTDRRERATPWEIEAAFARFNHCDNDPSGYRPPIRLHLI